MQFFYIFFYIKLFIQRKPFLWLKKENFMRKIININGNWKFIKDDCGYEKSLKEKGEMINLPHTWNNVDGQDGGLDYHRGTCYYVKEFNVPECDLKKEEVFIEFNACNASATVYLNGEELGHHDGGYSRFRFKITSLVKDKNVLVVAVDNSVNKKVYPQRADFTFYGGIYRDVNLIVVDKNHFDLETYGSSGFKVDTTVIDNVGICNVTPYVVGTGVVKCRIEDKEKNVVILSNEKELKIKDVHLWNGLKDPYLYTLYVSLYDEKDTLLDEVSCEIGFRTFKVDPKRGFFLNGHIYPLRGVAKHQDREGKGNAVSKTDLEEDIALIVEMGANTVRLAHYQHDDYTYTLCDRAGLVVWSEIPYISKHEDEGDENTMSQMRELIHQTYNHPSIFVRGLSNEITMMRAGRDRLKNHQRLEKLVKELDPHRLTVTAGFAAIGDNNRLNFITDVFSFNFYFGWYVPGTFLNNLRFFWFHLLHRKTPVGLSEYGAEAMPNLHAEKPRRFDNTEEYSCIYHEKMIKFFETHQYLWATHVWNMFDFGADGRNQGGDPGKNHKGLVTFDRKTKKDPFYLYKAWLSDDKFVHLCSKRFVNRTGKTTLIKAYSNLDEVSFYLNGQLYKKVTGKRVFTVKMPLKDNMEVLVRSGEYEDRMTIRKVAKKDPSYIQPKGGNSYSWEKKKANADEGAKRS